jgi:hypothetical protein
MSESSEIRWGLSENPTSKRHIEPRKNSRPMLSEDRRRRHGVPARDVPVVSENTILASNSGWYLETIHLSRVED